MALRYTNSFQLVKTSLPHVTITLIVVGYLFLGAAIFLVLEKDKEFERKQLGYSLFRRDYANFVDFVVETMNATDDILDRMDNSSTRYTKIVGAKKDLRWKVRTFLQSWDEISKSHSLLAKELFEDEFDTKWNFPGSVLFTFSLITTIGYGSVAPVTMGGRMFCIFYGLLGIPLTMICIANVGKFLAEALWHGNTILRKKVRQFGHFITQSALVKLIRHKKGKCDSPEANVTAERPDISPEGISVPFLLVGFFLFVALGAVLLPQYEEMDFFTACYFSFISITTVGFGDMYPRRMGYYLGVTLLYLTCGLALTTLAIEVSADYLLKFHYFGQKIKNAKSALVRFGNKYLTVADLIGAVGQQCGVDAADIAVMTENLDEIVQLRIEEKEAAEANIFTIARNTRKPSPMPLPTSAWDQLKEPLQNFSDFNSQLVCRPYSVESIDKFIDDEISAHDIL